MVSDSLQKEQLRKDFLKKRSSLTKKQVKTKSKSIVNKLLKREEFESAEVIHSYISIKKNNEVDTSGIISTCFDYGKQVIVPKVINQNQLQHYQINSLHRLKKNKWGIPEPTEGKIFPLRKIELVIVPMVAGDYFKNRLGYGKGYYDQFLEKCNAYTIGLLFNCQLYEDKIPVEHYDVALDILITETKIIK